MATDSSKSLRIHDLQKETLIEKLVSQLHKSEVILCPPHRLVPSRTNDQSVTHRFEHCRIVIADDDSSFRETLLEMLEPEFDAVATDSGAEAIEVIEQTHVDLALFDMHMPDLTGLDAIRQIKQSRIDLPCILMTARYSELLHQQATEAHAEAVLRKPVSRRRLISALTSALDL